MSTTPIAPISRHPARSARVCGQVLGARIDAMSWNTALARLLGWARERESRYVAICNAHVVVSASLDADYGSVIHGADMATPDGTPVAWMLRRQGHADQPRINGPDLMWALCERCAHEGVPIYCYGSMPDTLVLLEQRLRAAFPTLQMSMESPPYRTLTPQEDEAAVQRINASGAGIVFVALGCPKQERWMAEHRGRVQAVTVGVGAAFDFHAGTIARAPLWMQNNGLEWLHRLVSEPRRLWKRYLVTNTLFIVGAVRQLLSVKQNSPAFINTVIDEHFDPEAEPGKLRRDAAVAAPEISVVHRPHAHAHARGTGGVVHAAKVGQATDLAVQAVQAAPHTDDRRTEARAA